MKTTFFSIVAIVMAGASVRAAEIVAAGRITAYAPETGRLVLQPDSRAGNPLVFQNMDKARVLMASGETVAPASLQAGQMVTVHYQETNEGWMLSKVVVGNTIVPTVPTLVRPSPGAAPVIVNGTGSPAPAATTAGGVVPNALPAGERKALTGGAVRDGDITTQPGSKATIDRDITTQPGAKAAIDRDITTQPGAKAATDRDITTQPGSKAATDRDITTKPGSN